MNIKNFSSYVFNVVNIVHIIMVRIYGSYTLNIVNMYIIYIVHITFNMDILHFPYLISLILLYCVIYILDIFHITNDIECFASIKYATVGSVILKHNQDKR